MTTFAKKKQKLTEQIEKLTDQLKLLEIKEKNFFNTGIFPFLKNTVWGFDLNQTTLAYRSPNDKKDPLENFVFGELNMWPHGATYIDKGVELLSSDNYIEIRFEPDRNFESLEETEIHLWNKIIKFCKDNKIIVDLSSVVDQVVETTKKLTRQNIALKTIEAAMTASKVKFLKPEGV